MLHLARIEELSAPIKWTAETVVEISNKQKKKDLEILKIHSDHEGEIKNALSQLTMRDKSKHAKNILSIYVRLLKIESFDHMRRLLESMDINKNLIVCKEQCAGRDWVDSIVIRAFVVSYILIHKNVYETFDFVSGVVNNNDPLKFCSECKDSLTSDVRFRCRKCHKQIGHLECLFIALNHRSMTKCPECGEQLVSSPDERDISEWL